MWGLVGGLGWRGDLGVAWHGDLGVAWMRRVHAFCHVQDYLYTVAAGVLRMPGLRPALARAWAMLAHGRLPVAPAQTELHGVSEVLLGVSVWTSLHAD